jgi:long-chain fatty acid transport protein
MIRRAHRAAPRRAHPGALASCCLALLALAAIAGPAAGQSNVEIVELDFSTPGARSLGLGGAFLGLADDATAAYANPAGLTILSRPEVSLEGRRTDVTHVFTDAGNFAGAPSGLGIDTVAGLVDGTATSRGDGLSFLSVVYPRQRWAAALYRHELAGVRAGFKARGAFIAPGRRLKPTRSSLALDIENLGFSLAWEPLDDRLSIGAGVSLYRFAMDSRIERFDLTGDVETAPGGFYGEPSYAPDNLVDQQVQSGRDEALGWNVGVLWHAGGGWTLGGVYRKGPRFDLAAATRSGPRSPVAFDREIPAVFDTPDFLGLGIAWQPTDSTTFTLDVDRVAYSDITDSLVGLVGGGGGRPLPAEELRQYRIDDAWEVHLGFERRFDRGARRPAPFLRLGAWNDPDHRLAYHGDSPDSQALFRAGEDELHGAAGLGLTDPAGRLEVNLGVDVSERRTTASISTVIRF